MKIPHLIPPALASIVSLSNAASPRGMPVIIAAIQILGDASNVNADQVGSGYTISICGQIVLDAADIVVVQIALGVAGSCVFGGLLGRPCRE